MAALQAASRARVEGGFNFENTRRNGHLSKGITHGGDGAAALGITAGMPGGFAPPRVLKTGTTIVGCIFNGGVVLGADTRATSSLVVDKNCAKIHYMAPNMYCCGAGTAADTEFTTGQISSQLELLRLNTGTSSRVVTAVTMLKRYLYKYQGHVSAALVLGGVDAKGSHLHTIYPHGSTDNLPFVTMGSGSLAAMSVFESQYKDDMTEVECRDMVVDAIRAGVFNDLGSGSNVDLCIIRKDDDVTMLRNYQKPNDVAPYRSRVNLPPGTFQFPPGTTPVKQDLSKLIEVTEQVTSTAAAAAEADAMDTS